MPMMSERLRNLIREHREILIFAGMLFLALALFWWRVWTPALADRMYFTDDILIKDYPTRLALFREALAGYLPLWDAYQFGGWPGIANCEAGFFYPLNWLMLPWVGEPQSAYFVSQLIVLLHLFIAGMGAYCFARFIGLSPMAAALAAIAYTFCGFHCAHKKHTNMLFVMVWYPWLLLLAERWARDQRVQRLFPLALLLALAFLAGHPQASLYIVLLLFARMLYAAILAANDNNAFPLQVATRRMIPVVSALAFATLMTSIQWLPTVDLIRQGERADAGQFERSAEFSLPPHELIDAVLPEALRHWSQTEIFYWGMAPLLLALLTVLRGRFDPLQKFLLASAIASVLLALGEHLFVFDITYLLAPGVAWVRAPSRWIYFASLPIALFAGMALDWLSTRLEEVRGSDALRNYWRVLSGAGVMLFFLLILITLIVTGEGWQQAAALAHGAGGVWMTGVELRILFNSVLLFCLATGIFFLLFYLFLQGRMTARAFGVGMILLTWLDLGAQYRVLDLAPGVGGYRIDETVEALHEATWNHRVKVFLGGGGVRDLYHGAAQNFRELDGNSPLTPRINLELRRDTAITSLNNTNLSLFELLGVRAVIADFDFMPQKFRKETDLLYLRDDPAVTARVLPVQFPVGAETQRELVSLQSFPYNRVAMIEPDGETRADLPTPENALFPKPFLLVSASINAVRSGAYLIVDGKDYFEDLGRDPGYYFAVAHPATGKIERAERFNLMASVSVPNYPDHARMAQFIDSIPEGRVVFAAVRDNAANVLLPRGVAALRKIGASLDVRSGYRLAHAIIGQKGAPIGSAVEIASPTEALVFQTSESVIASGAAAPMPQPEWEIGSHFAFHLHSLFEKIGDDRFDPAIFPPEARDAGPGLPPIVTPMSVYSSIQRVEPSGGFVGGKAGIVISGSDASPNRVGYNLVVYNPRTHEIEAADSFDLIEDYDPDSPETGHVKNPPVQNRRMQEFIRNAPDGQYILGAVRGESVDMLIPETIAVLRGLGSRITYLEDPDARKSITHAFIAVKGERRIVEQLSQGDDSFVYARWLGGPALMRSDMPESIHAALPNQPDWVFPIDPVQQIFEEEYKPSWASTAEPGDVWRMESLGPNRLRVSGVSETGGVALVGEIFAPGWRAYVNGGPRPLRRTHYYFRGVEVGPGAHEIEMVYRPLSFTLGVILSMISVAFFTGAWFYSRKREDLE